MPYVNGEMGMHVNPHILPDKESPPSGIFQPSTAPVICVHESVVLPYLAKVILTLLDFKCTNNFCWY